MSQPTGGPRPPAAPPSEAEPSTPVAPAPARSSGMPRYGLRARVADWYQARADARAGLPSLAPGRPGGTPTLEEYAQDFLARSHRERLRLDVEVAPLLEAQATVTTRIAETEEASLAAEKRLESMPVLLDAEALALRRGGEVDTPDDVVAARRAREWDAVRRPVADEATRLRSRVSDMRVELARLRSAVRAREIAGATRLRRLHAVVMRRISGYERHLVRRHPAGDRIGPVLAAQHPRIPGWVLAAEDPDTPSPLDVGARE